MIDSPKRKKSSPSDRPETGLINIQISSKASIGIALVLLLPYVLMAVVWFGGSRLTPKLETRLDSSASAGKTSATTNAETVFHLSPGPWGDIEYVPFYIECPEEFLDVRSYEKIDRRWFFGGYSQTQLDQLFNAANLSEKEKSQLASAKIETATNGLYLTPPNGLILSLTPQAREKIYNTLAKFPENSLQSEVSSYPAASAHEYFAKSGLPEATLALIKKLSYPHGKLMLFADMPTVLDTIPDYQEKLRLAKTLSRRATMLMRLRLNTETDVNALLKYWGRAGYGKDLRPFLESVANVPGGARVSIINLLPPGPTARLYTYPFPSLTQPENCHWTSFNFFRETPDPNLTDIKIVKAKLDADYYPVFSDPRYGDLVFLIKPSGEIVHSAVFLADDVVYTKNGGHFTAPWMLAKIPDLLDSYSTFADEAGLLKAMYYRNKYY